MLDKCHEPRSPPQENCRVTYAQGMAAQVLLPSEPLATRLTGVGALTGVRADVPLEDALLFGSVRAERTLVELDGDHQYITWGTR